MGKSIQTVGFNGAPTVILNSNWLEIIFIHLSEQKLPFSVTTISSTTYSTTTTITATMPFNICPDCPENDTMIKVPSMFFYPDLILIISRFYRNFIEILSNTLKSQAEACLD